MLVGMSSALISWKSHLQWEVVFSTIEGMYLAATKIRRQLKLFNLLIAKLGLTEAIEGAAYT